METLPSQHLFREDSLQHAPYQDLDYLKSSKQLQTGSPEISITSNLWGEKEILSFRNLNFFYKYLNVLNKTKKSRVILFNSVDKEAEHHKSIIDFAKILSQHGNRVIVLNCDLRAGGSKPLFDLQPGIGVADYVSGNMDLDSLINETYLQNVYAINSGNVFSNPVKILMSQILIQLIENLKGRFEYVLVNSPPYQECIDAFVLVKFLRPIVLLLGGQSQNNTEEINAVRDELRILNLPVLSLVEA